MSLMDQADNERAHAAGRPDESVATVPKEADAVSPHRIASPVHQLMLGVMSVAR
jgi:hypothetical protein